MGFLCDEYFDWFEEEMKLRGRSFICQGQERVWREARGEEGVGGSFICKNGRGYVGQAQRRRGGIFHYGGPGLGGVSHAESSYNDLVR